MNYLGKIGLAAASLMLTGLIVGCGGGGGGSSDEGAITDENVENLAAGISNELGCEYVSAGTAQNAAGRAGILAIGKVGSTVLSNSYELKPDALKAQARACTPVSGSCGGTATLCQSGSSIVADFSDYCTEDYGGVMITIDGKAIIGFSESGTGDSATYTASTQTPLNVKTENPNTSEDIDITVSLNNGKAILVDGTCGSVVTASSITVTDNIAKETYSAKNVRVELDENCNVALDVDYTDPQMGTTHISGTADMNGSVSLSLTDSKGSTATFTSPGTNIFTVTTNGNETGTMDCSNADTSILDGLIPLS